VLTVFHVTEDVLIQTVLSAEGCVLPANVVWIDLLSPTRDEELAIERILGIEVPTRDEMQEIELSSRLYVADAALVMTMPVIVNASTLEPESVAITFVLADHCLVTVRYAEPAPFLMFIRRALRQPALASTGEMAFLGLLDQITDRLADIMESTTADVEKLSRALFQPRGGADLQGVLRRIGRAGDLATKAQDSLLGLSRLLLFVGAQAGLAIGNWGRIDTLSRDVTSITEHAAFLSGKVSFLLDASLGLINIEQNNIIKIFSVAAVAFLPPTLIASIYGMNFRAMPELQWDYGYPYAIGLMVLSALIPLAYFRRKKWM
jgi:magnesium transporter